MKKILGIALLASLSSNAFGATAFKGSDTMAGAITDAIVAAGLDGELTYEGGGSGKGEAAIAAGEQGLAPMSRAVKAEAKAAALAKSIELVEHKVALDGVEIFVNSSNSIEKIDVLALKNIFSCLATDWKDVPFSGKTGPITVYRRNDVSGTTDTFKNLVKIDKFGDCVKVMPETVDIANATATDASAIGYSGRSAGKEGNKALSLSKGPGEPYYLPTVQNIRGFKYPLSRFLFVYEAKGARTPNAAEGKLLNKILDRSFMDPIVQANEFYTLD